MRNFTFHFGMDLSSDVERLDYIANGKVALQAFNNSRDARGIPIVGSLVITPLSFLACIEVYCLQSCHLIISYEAVLCDILATGHDGKHHVDVNGSCSTRKSGAVNSK